MTNTKLKICMNVYGLSPGQVASICGVKVSAVYAWLSKGQTQPISDKAARILVLSCRLYEETGEWPI